MKRFRFNKIKWDKILSAALVIVLLVGCVAGLAAIFTTKTTDVSDFEFKKGALDSAGYYIESDTSIYTKDLIECQGLVIEPDFEATGKYQVFYYSANKTFVGASDQFDAHLDGIYEKGDTFNFAKYCRIVISPDAPVDEDNRPVDEWKIHFWEVAGYADDYKISVNKKQGSVLSLSKVLASSSDVCEMLGEGRFTPAGDTFSALETGFYFFDHIDVSKAHYLIMKVDNDTLTDKVNYNEIEYSMPMLYSGYDSLCGGTSTENVIEYSILESDEIFSYIVFDVTGYSDIYGCVDVQSADVLEIYLY